MNKTICPSCKGRKASYYAITCKKCEDCSNENNNFWIEDPLKLTYNGVHSRIKREFGTPQSCENYLQKIFSFNCSEKFKRFEWANKTGQYLITRDDWYRLCSYCHKNYDMETRTIKRLVK